jgi:hypothetical protein
VQEQKCGKLWSYFCLDRNMNVHWFWFGLQYTLRWFLWQERAKTLPCLVGLKAQITEKFLLD